MMGFGMSRLKARVALGVIAVGSCLALGAGTAGAAVSWSASLTSGPRMIDRGKSQAPPTAPGNDDRQDAFDVGSLPAAVNGTTVGATVERTEPRSGCARTGPSVWYRFTVGAEPPKRLAVELNANGDLDAVVDVFVRQRSQNLPVTCELTDRRGNAALAFSPHAATTYLVRVAERSDSVSGSFGLQVFPLPPIARPPGTPLPRRGATGTLERVINATAAYSARLTAGNSYRLNLVGPLDLCMGLGIYPPGTRSFDGGSIVGEIPCSGYRLFTPRVSGMYSFVVGVDAGRPGPQAYHLQIAPATDAETAPGVFLRNYQKVHGTLHGNRIDVLRLYSFDVTSRSNLRLALSTRSRFDLELVSKRGRIIECACFSRGDKLISRDLDPGHYFAVVRARDFSSGKFSLYRHSRLITSAAVTIDGVRSLHVSEGAPVSVHVSIAPAVDGHATVEIDRFDPTAGWQFYRLATVTVDDGSATLPFTPPYPGSWLFRATFDGSRTANPSTSKYANLVWATPLRQ